MKSNPFLVCCIIAILSWASFSFAIDTRELDIQWDDEYYVIALHQIALTAGLYLLVCGVVYFLLKTWKLNAWLTWSHILLTIGSLVILFFIIRGYDNKTAQFEYIGYAKDDRSLAYAMLALLFAFILFVINVLRALFKKIFRR